MYLQYILLTLYGFISLTVSLEAKRRFEYKYSFKGPYLAQKDGGVPFWEYIGDTIASQENVRIAPSLRSQSGAIWTKSETNFDWWTVEFVFRINGRGRVGADGLAFWYTAQKGVRGPVFGSSDLWNGLGLFFDSFDNDNKRNNPYVLAVVNNGSMQFDHKNDGSTQQLSGCLKDFRNKPFPIRVKVEYLNNILTVSMSNGMTNGMSDEDLELCLRAVNVHLPARGHFGLSAATGGLADDHDAVKFETYSVQTGEVPLSEKGISEEERRRLVQEYESMQSKLEQQREDYYREHPEATRRPEPGVEEYETESQRELRQIFSGQNHIFSVLREISRKVDEIVGRQERTMSMISTGGAQVAPGSPAGAPGVAPGIPSISRNEVEELINAQREMVQSLRDMRAYVTEIHQKSTSILQGQSGKPASQSLGYDFHGAINEVKDGINDVKRDIGMATQRMSSGGCPEIPETSCLSPTLFVVFAGIQLILLIGCMIYRDNKEDQRKKFY